MTTGMKPEQRRYALNRVRDIFAEKQNALVKKHTKPCPTPGEKAMLDAIKWGDVSLKCRSKLKKGIRTTLLDAFEFDNLENETKLNEVAYAKDLAKLNESRNEVEDQIMLGDAQEAIEILQQFCKGN